MRIGSMKQKNPNFYNSNHQKMAEPLPSTRNNAPGQNGFAASTGEHGQTILCDLPINHNLQKSGEHGKVDRQNSFALYGYNSKRGGLNTLGHKQTPHELA